MAEIQGLGLCGICWKDIQDPITGTASPIRHYKGHQLAHKHCFDAEEALKASPEYKVKQAHDIFKQAFTAYRVADANFRTAVQRLKDMGEEPDFEGNPHPEI
ncbi:MAG TPA: hypothetical protein VH164_05320 [Ktedonobacteraceae bacterium]|jgi:hypothetical protein|nr:hypothetical protein [Ktedonobacteraceae bacterium]